MGQPDSALSGQNIGTQSVPNIHPIIFAYRRAYLQVSLHQASTDRGCIVAMAACKLRPSGQTNRLCLIS